MPCSVGISTDPKRKKEEWELKVSRLRKWHTEGPYRTKEAAQKKKRELIARYNCQRDTQKAEAPGLWYVYMIEYIGKK